MLCWILSRIGIKENELVDSVAKEAQNDAIDSNFKIPYSDIKEHVNMYISNKNGRITEIHSLTINYIK